MVVHSRANLGQWHIALSCETTIYGRSVIADSVSNYKKSVVTCCVLRHCVAIPLILGMSWVLTHSIFGTQYHTAKTSMVHGGLYILLAHTSLRGKGSPWE